MGRFAQADLDRIREGFPIILEHYGINPNRSFSVPWRKETKPSVNYWREQNIVKDFGGEGKSYDAIAFVGAWEGLTDFKEQVARAAEIIGLQVGSDDSSTPISYRPKPARPRFEAPNDAGFIERPLLPFASLMCDCLESKPAKSYLHGRGFCNHDIYQNVLGYVPNKNCIVNDDGRPMFTKYEPKKVLGYVVIPFPVDETFCTVNYCMLRAIPADEPPEYKELRPTGYKSALYREYLLAASVDTLYICEGLLDAMALEAMIGRPCLGLGGTDFWRRVGQVLNCTPESQRPKKIILALDADAPGREASAKIAADLSELEIPHSNFDMPDGCKDPCDLLIRQLQIGGE